MRRRPCTAPRTPYPRPDRPARPAAPAPPRFAAVARPAAVAARRTVAGRPQPAAVLRGLSRRVAGSVWRSTSISQAEHVGRFLQHVLAPQRIVDPGDGRAGPAGPRVRCSVRSSPRRVGQPLAGTARSRRRRQRRFDGAPRRRRSTRSAGSLPAGRHTMRGSSPCAQGDVRRTHRRLPPGPVTVEHQDHACAAPRRSSFACSGGERRAAGRHHVGDSRPAPGPSGPDTPPPAPRSSAGRWPCAKRRTRTGASPC